MAKSYNSLFAVFSSPRFVLEELIRAGICIHIYLHVRPRGSEAVSVTTPRPVKGTGELCILMFTQNNLQ
jgi:hypothetical protein